MVLVIVSRNIDLSVGSLVGIIAMTYALLMTDWLPNILGHRRRLPVPLGHRAGARHRRRGGHRRAPGLHHRLHRRAVVHRHARRAAVDPRRRLVPLAAAPPCRAWTRTSSSSAAGPQGSIGGTLTWVLGARRLRRDRRAAHQRPPAAPAVRVPAPADVGRGPARRRRAAWPSSAWPRSPTPTSGRRASPTGRRRAERGPDARRAAG